MINIHPLYRLSYWGKYAPGSGLGSGGQSQGAPASFLAGGGSMPHPAQGGASDLPTVSSRGSFKKLSWKAFCCYAPMLSAPHIRFPISKARWQSRGNASLRRLALWMGSKLSIITFE